MDAYVLPRATLALFAGGLLAGAGLLWGRRSLGALRLPALAVALAAVVAAAVSVSPAASLVGVYSRYESLPMRMAYLGMFCGAAWLGERRRTVAAYLAGCAVVAAETLYQAATHSLPRPDGNLGQANLLGALLAMAIPLAIDRAWRGGRKAGRAWLGLAGFDALALTVSSSRSGWLGALTGACVLAAFLAPRRRLGRPIGLAALLLALAVGGLLLSPLRGLNQDTGAARLGVWRDSLALVAERPLAGWGEDTMGVVFGRYQTADWEPGHNFDRAHSMPLDLAASQGLLGLAACTWLFGAWWWRLWRRRDLQGTAGFAGAAAAYLAWSMLNFDWAPATAAFWLLAGAGWPGERQEVPVYPSPLAGEVARPRGPREIGDFTGWEGRRGPPSPPAGDVARIPAQSEISRGGSAGGGSLPGWGKGVMAGLAVGVALACAVPPMAADLALYAGQTATAARLDPLQPRYHAALGTLSGLRRASDLGDPDPSTYVELGDAEARAGHRQAATAAYRRALDRYPYDTDAQQRLASAPRTEPSGTLRAASG